MAFSGNDNEEMDDNVSRTLRVGRNVLHVVQAKTRLEILYENDTSLWYTYTSNICSINIVHESRKTLLYKKSIFILDASSFSSSTINVKKENKKEEL